MDDSAPVHDPAPILPIDGFILERVDDALELRREGERPGTGVRADFQRLDLRPGSPSLSRRQPLARAIGARTHTIIDATAGLGGDTLMLAALGWNVTAIERSPIVAALLADGLVRARADERLAALIGDRITLLAGEARCLIGEIEPHDVVYVDPMYPPRRKASALPRKEIQYLRAILGDDADTAEAADLVECAVAHAHRRVVVKRPRDLPPLRPEPTMSFEGKLVRYDVWTTG